MRPDPRRGIRGISTSYRILFSNIGRSLTACKLLFKLGSGAEE